MGQKVNPNGLRLGIIKTWDARWYAPANEVPELLQEDLRIRKALDKKFANASVSKTIIERSKNRVIVTIYTAKPGMNTSRNQYSPPKIQADPRHPNPRAPSGSLKH